MTVFQMLYQLVFYPLELVFEVIYGVAYNIVGNAGAAIIPLSLCVNILCLPLYNRAEAIQKQEREKQRSMLYGLSHIRKTFQGDERYMMIQAFYRINHYKPIYALRSSLPLLLEIPFFVAAYHFLSNLPYLEGASFGPFVNLAAPDGLIKIGGIAFNFLPIAMTLINILSSMIYSRDMSKKDKIQLYAMALIFLLLLYNSPSGLVLYWTLNNIFSLAKNLINSVENRGFIIDSVLSVLGLITLIYAFLVYRIPDLNQLLLIVIGGVLLIWAILDFIRRRGKKEGTEHNELKLSYKSVIEEKRTFIIGCVFLTILIGLMIPSSVIKSSPEEFIVISQYSSPLHYLLSSFLLAAGMFLIWFGLFYYLAGTKVKMVMCCGVWILSIFSIVNYMLFGTELGNLSAELKYDIDLNFSINEILVNLIVLLLIGAACMAVWIKQLKFIKGILFVIVVASSGMSVYNIIGTNSRLIGIKEVISQTEREQASFSLSKKGRNVIVFMLDRAISSYVPYLIQEKPDLLKQFDGFTWYPNTLSYGTRTNTGSPALFGGYEYTPEEINKRDKESLEEKQNEALKVMPVLFDEHGYDVTVCDPPYAGYTWIPDLSIYDEYENIHTYNTENGQFTDQTETLKIRQQIWNRNLFCYGVMKTLPMFIQPGFYQKGSYFNPQAMNSALTQMQYMIDKSLSVGIWNSFMDSYSALCALPEMTKIEEGDKKTFLMINNGTPHNAILLQEPQYEPELIVDNTLYDKEYENRFTIGNRILKTDTSYQMSHYQSNMAAFLRVGKWLDYLKEQGVYDNTRIIIVADHGWPLEQFDDMKFGEQDPERTIYNSEDVMAYNPLLMVKDYADDKTYDSGFHVNYSFMTNADTPTIAFDGLISDPVNPFTGNVIDNEHKNENEHHVFYTDMWGTEENNGNTFLPGFWYSLKGDNIFDMSSWSSLGVH